MLKFNFKTLTQNVYFLISKLKLNYLNTVFKYLIVIKTVEENISYVSLAK